VTAASMRDAATVADATTASGICARRATFSPKLFCTIPWANLYRNVILGTLSERGFDLSLRRTHEGRPALSAAPSTKLMKKLPMRPGNSWASSPSIG
jgi:hypothetical protein